MDLQPGWFSDNKTSAEMNLYLEKGKILLVTPLIAVLCRCKFIGVGESQATQNEFFSSPAPPCLSPPSTAACFSSDGAEHLHSSPFLA